MKPTHKFVAKFTAPELVIPPSDPGPRATVTPAVVEALEYDSADEAISEVFARTISNPDIWGAIRFSSKHQRLGSSEWRQLERIKAACAQRGWVFDAKDEARLIADYGVSAFKKNAKTGVAKNLDRDAAFGRFLALALKDKLPIRAGCSVRLVVFENVDRFSRSDIYEADSTLWALVRAGILVFFIANNIILRKGDENNHSIRQLLLGEMARANSESKLRSYRVKTAKASQLVEIQKGNIVRLGGIVPAWLAWDDATCRYTLVPEKAAIITRLVEALLDNRPLNAICTQFNLEKVPMMESGKQWSPAYMRILLVSPALVGTLVLKGHIFPGFYPAVLTQDQFNIVSARFAVKVRRGGAGGIPARASILNLFPGRVFCAHCGIPMSAETRRARNHLAYFDRRAYVCRGSRIGSAAEGRSVCQSPARTLIDAVELDFFRMFLEQKPVDILTEKDDARQASRAALVAERVKLVAEANKLGQLLLAVSTDELIGQGKGIKLRISAIDSKISQLDQDSKIDVNCNSTWSEVLGVLKSAMNLKEVSDEVFSGLLSEGSQLVDQLTNQEVRSRLVFALRSVIKHIELDSDGQRYRVHSHTGAASEWRNLSTLLAVLKSRLADLKWTPEARERMSKSKKASWAGKGLSESHKALLSSTNKVACKWSPERRARFELQKSQGFVRKAPTPFKGRPWTPERRAAHAARIAAGWKPKARAKGLTRNAKPWSAERLARFQAKAKTRAQVLAEG
jgi:hypothetical protein